MSGKLSPNTLPNGILILILQENVFYNKQSLKGFGLQSQNFLVTDLIDLNEDSVTSLEHECQVLNLLLTVAPWQIHMDT